MRQANGTLPDIDAFRKAISEFHRSSGSWRTVGDALGKSASYAMRIARGDLTPSEDAVRNWHYFTTGKAPKLVEVPACPDCGQVHTGRCYGKPIVEVAVLSSNERVVRAGKPRKRKPTKALRLPPELWERLNQERRAAGASWADYITSLTERGTNGEPASR